MQLNPRTFDSVLNSFLARWTITDIQQLTIDKYADLSDHDSFCYWLEYGSKEIGAIGGIGLQKFELWKPKGEREVKGKPFISDGRYIWNRYKGDTSLQAFEEIKKLILLIVAHAQNGEWAAIDDIHFHSIVKWKIAFIYSKKRILPIYSRQALVTIAGGLGKIMTKESRVSVIQQYILSFKNAEEAIHDFAWGLWHKYVVEDGTGRNYYIVGSKYGDEDGKDVVPMIDLFRQHECIAIGFMGDIDFSPLIGAEPEQVNEFVSTHYEDSSVAIHKRQRYFRLLSQLKEGDIIAVKSHGSFGNLTIIAYAQVVSRSGNIYIHRPNDLGHCIHVDYLDAGFSKPLGLNYAETLHHVTPDSENFYKIFGWYSDDGKSEPEPEESSADLDSPANGYNKKNEDSFFRSAFASVKVDRIHNQIQNQFIKYLTKTYPDSPPGGEKKRMDVFRTTPDKFFIYEIKTSQSPYYCIREGIGQLMDYSHQEKTQREKLIFIVGQNEPEQSDIDFIDAIRQTINIPFKYIAFDKEKMMAKEF